MMEKMKKGYKRIKQRAERLGCCPTKFIRAGNNIKIIGGWFAGKIFCEAVGKNRGPYNLREE
jgi:hypothetical protein